MRNLKVQGKYVKSQSSPTGLKRYPTLTLSGAWLAEAGIKYGDRVTITETKNGILISK